MDRELNTFDHRFTAHNIRLDDGTQTLPSAACSMEADPVTQSVKRLLGMLYPNGVGGRTVIDVGCLEGGYTIEFARMGLDATGLEVRENNYRNCLWARSRVDVDNLRFRLGDANDIAQHGAFDVFFVAGLLYHLDRPRQFLERAALNCRKALIINTQVSHSRETPARQRYNLSDLCENEGLQGRWYEEHDEIAATELEALRWASWQNSRSFWVQKEHLVQLIRDLGFDIVFEQFDCLPDIVGEMTEGFYASTDWMMLVGIKSNGEG